MRAATSVSLTIGVAFATLVVVGGILAGPAILDCSHQGGGFGACLRTKVVESGLLSKDQSTVEVPVLSSESTLPVVPPAVAEAPRDSGWIEANAREYEVSPSGAAQLSAVSGRLDAAGAPPRATEAVQVALAAPAGRIAAGGLAPAPVDPVAAQLSPDAGSLRANGNAVAIADPAGTVHLPVPTGSTLITGSIGPTSGRAASAALRAELQPLPMPLVLPPPPLPPASRAAPLRKAPQTNVTSPKSRRVAPPIKYDARYPNVIVLPKPNIGENSSFATLEVR